MIHRLRSMVKTYRRNGFSRDVFHMYREQIEQSTLHMLTSLSLLSFCVPLLLLCFAPMLSLVRRNAVLYAILTAAGLVTYVLCRTLYQKNKRYVLLNSYLLANCIYGVAIVIGVWQSPTLSATLFCGAQLGLGVFILDDPLRLNSMNLIAMAVFCLSASRVKPPDVAEMDMLNAVVFFAVGQVMLFHFNRSRLSQIISREEIVRQRDTDELTQLQTRSTAERCIGACLYNDAARAVMLLLDLDHFKRLNDTMGHQMGDRVLRETADAMRKLFRASDHISRLGGDEFIIFIKQVPDTEWTLQKADAVRSALRREVVDEHGTSCPISVSIGIAFARDVGCTYEEMYRAADAAMYRAKAAGGDCAKLWAQDMPILKEEGHQEL